MRRTHRPRHLLTAGFGLAALAAGASLGGPSVLVATPASSDSGIVAPADGLRDTPAAAPSASGPPASATSDRPVDLVESGDGGAATPSATPTPAPATSPEGDERIADADADERRPDRIDQMRLACRALETDRRAGAVGCKWEGVRGAQAYRLWRVQRGVDRTAVYRGSELHHVDAPVELGHRYGYVVEALSRAGRVVARSEIVVVPVPPTDKNEELRLVCRAVEGSSDVPDGDAPQPGGTTSIRPEHRVAVGCAWSESEHPAAAGYRLVRTDGDGRVVVFATRDLGTTRHLDHEVEPGSTYGYVVQVLAADGRVVGSGGPVKVAL